MINNTSSNMSLVLAIFLGVFGCFAHGVPLENPSNQLNTGAEHIPTIIGGGYAPKTPHMAGLIFGELFTSFMCGGSIVSKHHILSAAHCIAPLVTWTGELISSFRAVVGTKEWQSMEKVVRFSGFVNHPHYDSAFIKNDIGVLFLAEELELSVTVAVVPLSFDWVGGGEDCSVTGWGHTQVGGILPEKLQVLKVQTMSHSHCEREVQIAGSWGWAPPVDKEIEICTFHSFGHGMCNGDSGSALVSTRTDSQIGIVSWGFPCALGFPDVFVRISGFKTFLKTTIGPHI